MSAILWAKPLNPPHIWCTATHCTQLFFCFHHCSFLKYVAHFVASAVILLVYWFLCVAANPSDPYSISGWFGTAVDKSILGEKHMYRGEGIAFDPEGLMSTFAAIVQVVLGYLVGNYILQKENTGNAERFICGPPYWCLPAFAGIWFSLSIKKYGPAIIPFTPQV